MLVARLVEREPRVPQRVVDGDRLPCKLLARAAVGQLAEEPQIRFERLRPPRLELLQAEIVAAHQERTALLVDQFVPELRSVRPPLDECVRLSAALRNVCDSLERGEPAEDPAAQDEQ